MKKLYHFFLAIGCWLLAIGNCHAQYVTIPDTAFANWLNANTVLKGCMKGNMLDTTCAAVLSKKTILCGGNIRNLTGIQYFKNLDTLSVGAQITNLSILPSSIQYLDCGYNQLTSLPTLPTSLVTLICVADMLTSLPALPSTLVMLICNNNKLTALPSLPSSIQSLDCSVNQLTGLPVLPSSLYNFSCNNNRISSLPALPSPLHYFYCENNQLTGLPVLPLSLQQIWCYNNHLTNLPAIPDSVYDLECSSNLLTVLPTLPLSLNDLGCSNNPLTGFSSWPPYLTYLNCDSDGLTTLPLLPVYLKALYCNDNQLTSLPAIPTSLDDLDCSSNNLSNLPILPLVIEMLRIENNPMIKCLPPIKSIAGYDDTYFNIAGTGITCLPGRISHPLVSDFPAIDTMPICTVFNPNGCEVAWNITGNTFFGGNYTCDTTITEPGLGKIKLDLFDSTGKNLLQQVFTNGDGSYSFNTSLGKFVVKADTSGTPFYVVCPDTNSLHFNVTTADSLYYNCNFRLACKNGYDLAVASVNDANELFFPARSTSVYISAGDLATYYGVYCNTGGLAGTVATSVSGPVTVISASGNGVISGNTVTWNVSDFSQINFATAFSLVVNTNTGAMAGDAVCVTATVTGNTGTDNNPANNTLTQCFTVVTSHDPNFKEVYPSNIDSANEWLTYTIHFQNTGTAAAQNIYVLDTIDPNLDISTIQVIAESNNSLIQVLPGRIVRFNFPNIFLPDSSDNLDSSVGYVQFKIKTISALAPGTTINNTASVYFDYNAPVITNNAASTFDVATSSKKLEVKSNKLEVYPNPTGGVVNLVLPQFSGEYIITLTDVVGRSLTPTPSPWERGRVRLDMSGLAAGVYFLRVNISGNVETVKVVKE